MSEQAIERGLLRTQKSPKIFIEHVLGDRLEAYQEKAAALIAEHERVAIKACHSVGKSFLLARIVIWFARMFPYSKVITTAPTGRQVKTILWSEIRGAYARSKVPLGGTMLTTEWQLTKEKDWYAIGFSPRSENSTSEEQGAQSSFQGFHAPHILVVFDEATGILPGVWKMVEGLLTTGRVKFVCIGNPTSSATNFFNCFKSILWKDFSITCFDSPNLIANGITDFEKLESEYNYLLNLSTEDKLLRIKSYKMIKPHLLSLGWVMSYALELGSLSHPLFVSKVLAEFPVEGTNVFVPLGAVEMAQLREYTPNEGDRLSIGVDVARYGEDKTVITILHGQKFIKKVVFAKRDTNEISGEVIALAKEYNADIICVDETGLGAGVVDNLNAARRDNTLHHKVNVRGVQFGASVECTIKNCDHKTCDKGKYVNIKARMFDLLGKDIKEKLTISNDSIYQKELPTIIYRYDAKGKLYVESKDEYKKRTGMPSPDHSDSLALANYGRYDSLEVGSFGETFNYDAPTHSGGGHNTMEW